mgnify:CR=1 FL=1
MKGLKLTLGIITILVSCYCSFFAVFSGLQDIFSAGNGIGIYVGSVVSTALLAAGIAAICTRKSKAGTLVVGFLYLAIFVVGTIFHGTHTWILVAAIYAFACALVFCLHGTWMDAPNRGR